MDTPTQHVVNICFIQDGRKRILLVLKRKAGRKDHWILPGGKQKPNENDTETIRRELAEELPGLTYDLGMRIVERHETLSISGEEIVVSAYLASTHDTKPTVCSDDSIIEARWFTAGEILDDTEDQDEEFLVSDATYEILEMLADKGYL